MRGILLFFGTLANIVSATILPGTLSWAGFAGISHAAAPAPEALPRGDFTGMRHAGGGRVLQVVSPQEIQLADGRIVRLSGLYFPDYSTEEAGPFALLAMRVLKDMLEGRDVLLYQTPDKDLGRVDRMGRQLAHAVRRDDGAWAQGALLALGLAAMRTTQRTPEMAAQMLALERIARGEKLGLWEERLTVLTPEGAGAHIGSFQIVEGRVESAALNKNRLYLNFGKNWRDDFTVTVAPENRRAFSKGGVNPLEWNGRILRVRGWLSSYNGPSMEIDHIEAVEFPEASASAPESSSPSPSAPTPAGEGAEAPGKPRPADALPPPLPRRN